MNRTTKLLFIHSPPPAVTKSVGDLQDEIGLLNYSNEFDLSLELHISKLKLEVQVSAKNNCPPIGHSGMTTEPLHAKLNMA